MKEVSEDVHEWSIMKICRIIEWKEALEWVRMGWHCRVRGRMWLRCRVVYRQKKSEPET